MLKKEMAILKSKLVSIILPAYNCEKYIASTIKSVQNQSFNNWELIIVDDGSIDNTVEICNYFSKNDSRIRVFQVQNNGVSKARNIGISVAKGEYITFLDSDDLLCNKTIEKSIASIGDADLLIWGYETFPDKKIYSLKRNDIFFGKEEVGKKYSEIADKHLFNPVWNKLYRREIITMYSVFFPENLSMGEDLIFNLRYIQYCANIKMISECLYFYRKDLENSLSHKVRENALEVQIKLKEETDKAFENEPNVLKKTTIDFVNTIIDMSISVICNSDIEEKEKNRLITKWLTDRYFFCYYRKIEKTDKSCDWLTWKFIENQQIKSLFTYIKIQNSLKKKIKSWIKCNKDK